MAEFSEELQDWFVEMGYPLEDAESTEWKKLVCGRLNTFWKDVMNVIRPKQTITNIQKNILLREIREFEKKENTSAVKLGVILPPPQIYYPREREKLQKELDLLKLELLSEKNIYKLEMDERKQKCLELHEIKQEIMEAERKIYAMNESSKKLNKDINAFLNTTESIKQFKGYFVSKNEKSIPENMRKEFQDVLHAENNKIQEVKNENSEFSISKKITVSSKDVTEESKTEVYNESFIKKIPTAHLLNLIVDYQKEIPKILDRDIGLLSEKNNDNLKNAIKKGECTPLKESLSHIDLFHCQLVIATMNHKKEIERAKNATAIIKPKILEMMAGNDLKIDLFNQELSQISTTAYKKCLEEELHSLKTGQGFYLKFISNKLNQCQNINSMINNVNEKYTSLYSNIQIKSTAIITHLEQIKQKNNKVENNLLRIKKDSRADKVLWQSDYKELQDIYLKIILKKPSVFKMQTENPFESFIYLKTIIEEYNINEKLLKNKNLLENELKYLMGILKNNTNIFLSGCSEEVSSSVIQSLLNWKMMEYLRPLHYSIYAIIKQIKFKKEFLNFNNIQAFDEIYMENILGDYVSKNLKELEERSLLTVMEYLPKNNSSIINSTLDEFNETYEFVTDFIKNKENLNSTPKMK